MLHIALVGIHQDGLDAATQERIASDLAAAIEVDGRFDVLGPAEVAAAIRGREQVILEEGLLALPREALTSGRDATGQAAFDDALPSLEAAVSGFAAALAVTHASSDLWEAWALLGTAHLQRDPPDEVAARNAFASALALAPSKPLNPAMYPPSAVEVFELLRAERASHLGTMSVTTAALATIYVDGTERGASPLVLPGVFPGVHTVTARGDGTQGSVLVDLPFDAELPVSVPLGPPTLGPHVVTVAARARSTEDLYEALGNRAEGVDLVLLAGVSGSGLHLQLLDPHTDTFSRSLDVPYTDTAGDEAVQAVPLLLHAVTDAGTFTATAAAAVPLDPASNVLLAQLLTQPRAPTAQVPIPVVADARRSKLPLVLGIVGGVVAASATAGGIWLATREPEGAGGAGTIVVQF